MTTPIRMRLTGAALIPAVLVLDQLSKWLVFEAILHGRDPVTPLWTWLTKLDQPRVEFALMQVTPFFNLVRVWNKGVSFGLMNGFGEYGPVLLTAMALLMGLSLTLWLARSDRWTQSLPLGFVIGGAIGNAWDRVRFGAVADFLDFHAFDWHYPAFNVADTAIVCGIAVLLIDGLFLNPNRRKTEEEALT